MKFRKLTADEIDCRVKTVNQDGCLILLYKDARVDQNLLDETVGPMNWQKTYSRDNANCTVSIWDEDKQQWVSKEDTGTESQTESEKGLASDSFKRACFNWGIGRELYTAPYIFIDCKTEKDNNGKYKTRERFAVQSIGYDSKGNINQLVIVNAYGKKCYEMGAPVKEVEKPTAANVLVGKAHIATIRAEMKKKNVTEKTVLSYYKLENFESMSMEQFNDCLEMLKKTKVQS